MGFKKRSKYGEFIDKHLGYGGQEKVREVSKLTPNTITKACSDESYRPTRSTMKLLIDAAMLLTKQTINKDDFWM
ncbi:hypothetical protein PAECIP111891_03175 [Paenibacillus allorhizoplanae]|uniref:Transcriptional regulator n=1 Tax=Paenibacillus allorhizoplanae TaxID=2905648 RepID=A0ABM9CCZ6_9BACL|nr:transcriptional regulator [Paenibacillus allorhizoplanae]CAH1208202.1 hypothetical protein PAECIP111891_03175 [Paenibacillus allorhizoplanae]